MDPISQSLQKFGSQIGGQLFLPKPQTEKSFYEKSDDEPSIPNSLAFYSTTVASSYNGLERDRFLTNNCPLRLYIEDEVKTLSSVEREQPTCCCYPDNHLHVFRLPFIYFLIDGSDQQIIEILRTLKNNKIYTHSTNMNGDRKNLADKLIRLSQQTFKDEENLRLVSSRLLTALII